ncbi:MAG: hypothetical protein JW913_06010 [Chitinispirillaceae bacterium]|nr:hypothetical protein [Chitinispirillaceae bacterium]
MLVKRGFTPLFFTLFQHLFQPYHILRQGCFNTTLVQQPRMIKVDLHAMKRMTSGRMNRIRCG